VGEAYLREDTIRACSLLRGAMRVGLTMPYGKKRWFTTSVFGILGEDNT